MVPTDPRISDTALPHAETVAEPVTLSQLAPIAPPSSARITLDGPRYATLQGLGEGGMGEVRLCRDALVGREIALKTLRGRRGDDPRYVSRFLREARIQGQLEHPSVVPVYDLGADAEGRVFFTMKRVRGRTLDEAIADAEASSDPARARRKLLAAFAAVCHAVEYAHARGVLHRDLKPQNVMLGDFGEVYVLDWGIAKLQEDEAADEVRPITLDEGDDAKKTAAGDVLGTPGYMAPEQIRGGAIDARADVYALGTILFEMLAGLPLHEGLSVPALAASTLAGVEARPSVRVPGREVAPELEELCVRATATDPAERLPTVAALREGVERFLEGDRDVERRRTLSSEHAVRAEELATRALDGDTAARRGALEEAGRAIALDPGNDAAAALIVRLMSQPPRTVPDEVLREIERQSADASARAARTAGWVVLAMLLPAPFQLAMGIRDWPLFLTSAACLLFGAFLCFLRPPGPGGSATRRALIVISVLVSVFALGRVAGALIALPVCALGLGVGLALYPRAASTWLAIAIAAVGVLGPMLLELAGLIAPSYEIDGERICIVPHLMAFPRGSALLFLAMATVLPSAGIIVYLTGIRERLEAAQRNGLVQQWQLEQLAPSRK